MDRRSSSLSGSTSSSYADERSKTFVVLDSFQTEDEEDGVAGSIYTVTPPVEDMDKIVQIVNRKFAIKEKQIKKDMIDEFEKRMAEDRRDHDSNLKLLKRELTNLTKVSEECEHLKVLQKDLRKELNTQQEKIALLSQENALLKTNASKMVNISSENNKLKFENDKLKNENVKMEITISKLTSSILSKEKEIGNLKQIVDTQYKRLKLDLSNTRDKFHTEQDSIHAGMRKQQLMLTEISEVVKTISKGIEDEHKETPIKSTKAKKEKNNVKNKPFVSGKTSKKTSFNKLTG